MPLRRRRNPRRKKTQQFGGLPLTQAKLVVRIEAYADAFALPLFSLGVFVALAWLGVFRNLYPYIHLAALALFTAWFFSALGEAQRRYRRPSNSRAKRRLERANKLSHRPLDVMEDRVIEAASADQIMLWQKHQERTSLHLNKLKAPKLRIVYGDRDPYALRYALAILLLIGGITSWGRWGGEMLAAINPAMPQQWHVSPMLINAWITPPEYTGLPPIIISTVAGQRHDKDVIEVPENSVLDLHVGEKGDAPVLEVNGVRQTLGHDDHQDYAVSAVITTGHRIVLRRGWEKLGEWKIKVLPDRAPQIALNDKPAATTRQTVRLSYEANDDYGVTSVRARIAPAMSMPGVKAGPLEVLLRGGDEAPATKPVKDIKQTVYADLTAQPLAGLPVTLSLVAQDAVGHEAESNPLTFTLPERAFSHPMARALVEMRKQLLAQPDDRTRDMTANIMAGMARHGEDYRNDPLVLMALRSGAVRLVLDHDEEAPGAVGELMWQTALRIEDGAIGSAQEMLRHAQEELSRALASNASEAEIQQLIDKMQAALGRYLSELSRRAMEQNPQTEDLGQLLGPNTNMLTPQDLEKMLNKMRGLSATGAREAAQQQLAQLQQILENLNTKSPTLSAEQRQALEKIIALKKIVKDQQALLDETFRASQQDSDPSAHKKLADKQSALKKQIEDLMGKLGGEPENLAAGAQAMGAASGALGEGDLKNAMRRQGEALQDMQEQMQQMTSAMSEGLMMIGQGQKSGPGRDPFGRPQGNGQGASDDGSVRVPDQMSVERAREILHELQRRAGDGGRPKDERDYIERLLERF